MKRVPEPELMDSAAQTQAYAEADFNEANTLFVDGFVGGFGPLPGQGRLVDLGCGPADICIRLAQVMPGWDITGLDAGPNMLQQAARAVAAANCGDRVHLHLSHLPQTGLPGRSFDAVVSNSLLHHLPEPRILWQSVLELGAPGAAVTVMDLARPENPAAAEAIVGDYASDAPAVLREDFYNSLLAAYTPAEVSDQLSGFGLQALQIHQPSDRHWMVRGRLPG